MKVLRSRDSVLLPPVSIAKCCASCRFCHRYWPCDDPFVYYCRLGKDGKPTKLPAVKHDTSSVKAHMASVKPWDDWCRGRETQPHWVCCKYKERGKREGPRVVGSRTLYEVFAEEARRAGGGE